MGLMSYYAVMNTPIEVLNILGPIRDIIIFFVERMDKRTEQDREAAASLLEACNRTRQYIHQSNFNSNSDAEIAELWRDCSIKLLPVYPHGAGMAIGKSDYWSNSGYKDKNNYVFVATLDDMLEVAKELK